MITVTADPNLEELLGQLKEVANILDAQGNLMGTYTPNMPAEEQALYEKAIRLFNPAEMERILREERGKGVPLAEIWKKLESEAAK